MIRRPLKALILTLLLLGFSSGLSVLRIHLGDKLTDMQSCASTRVINPILICIVI
jgi:hypothetical protein